MPYIPKAPAELAHLDDRTVARALSRRFGDIVRAAEDLGAGRADRRSRQSARQPSAMGGRPASCRRQSSAGWFSAGGSASRPNPSAVVERARLAVEQQAAAERAFEREREFAFERERERERVKSWSSAGRRPRRLRACGRPAFVARTRRPPLIAGRYAPYEPPPRVASARPRR